MLQQKKLGNSERQLWHLTTNHSSTTLYWFPNCVSYCCKEERLLGSYLGWYPKGRKHLRYGWRL